MSEVISPDSGWVARSEYEGCTQLPGVVLLVEAFTLRRATRAAVRVAEV